MNWIQTLKCLCRRVSVLEAEESGGTPGSGTVTSVSVTTANGVSGVVATPTSTPAITLALGAITPTSVASSGAISGTTFTGSGAALTALNGTQITTGTVADARIASVLTGKSVNGVTLVTGGSSTAYLSADGTYSTPAGGGGGTVTTVSVVTANGVSGSVATATTTPAITVTLGAITPSSVAASGNVTGANLSGTNTGDQTTVTGNAGTATALQTARNINGVSFNGTANITVTADASTLTGTTLAALSGANLTALNGTQITTGTVADARIDAAIARLAGPAFTGTPSAPTAASGTSTTQLATAAFVMAALAGWNNIVAETTTARTIGLSDAGKYIRSSNAGTVTITIPTNAVTAFPIGTEIVFRRMSGAGAFALSNAGVTINNSALAATIAAHGNFAIKKVATDEWDLI